MASESKANSKKYVVTAARAADDKKAEDIKVLDLQGESTLVDYVLIATVASIPQMEAVEFEISKQLKDDGVFKLHRDGVQSPAWRVLDYGGFLVHLMSAETRLFYAIDKVYSSGKSVTWKKPVPRTASRSVKTKKKVAVKAKKAR